ncbi:outer membrane protein [Polynucleobacter sp. MWH-UH2A]|uniref:outer membrane protein n=1 Tax=Polynucleobacter sp. MWH-UH2A TaxID=1855617 RepID=UPI001BFECD6A|nr:outer membrane beta-barrel protein [Polynucleobacter sp. MWH-UH2A]QWD63713.1 outer membrane beta-barrel protein [Polynucleobacter sp. MWH-UH2A]
MRISCRKFLALAAAIIISSSTWAQSSQSSWAGAYGQIGLIGYESYIPKSASGTTTLPSGSTLTTNSTANHANGPVANLAVGYNFEVQNQFLLGLGAALYPGHSRSANTIAITHGAPTYGTYDVSNVFSFSLLPSYVIDGSRLAYLKIGYAGSTLNANSPGNYPQQSTRVSGIVYGAGYKQMITESVYGFLEGNYAVNKAKSVTVQTDSGAIVNSTLNATGYDFLIGVGYRF